MSNLFQDVPLTHDPQDLLRIRQRDRVLELRSTGSEPSALQRDRCPGICDTNADLVAIPGGHQAIANPNGLRDRISPAAGDNQEFALDLERHLQSTIINSRPRYRKSK